MNDENISPKQGLEIIRQSITGRDNLTFKDKISPNLKGYRQAAVLVPFVNLDYGLAICLTERSRQVEHHKGQIAFPGGMVEKFDQSPADTAIRETFEEIGIPQHDIEIIGRIDEVYSVSGYLIHPVVAEIKSLRFLKINPNEVKDVFFLPVEWLMESVNRYQDDFVDNNGVNRKVWFFSEYHGKIIWGITASILVQLIRVIEK